MSIRKRVDDALFLWNHNRLEGAFLSALIAVAATSRRQFPNQGDRQAFEDFLKQGVFERISVEYHGQIHHVYHIFYKWFRCQLVHEGGLPIDIEFMPDGKPGAVSIRAGGAPEYILKVSHGWFYELIHTVVHAPINADLFDDAITKGSDG
jgi:hypothetical protein